MRGEYSVVKMAPEAAALLRTAARLAGVRVCSVALLWPRCPACGAPLFHAATGIVRCPGCRREYSLAGRA